MKTLYRTKEKASEYVKQTYYHNEYRLEDDTVTQYKCGRFKFFDGDESNWEYTETKRQSWKTDDPNMPDWLKSKL